MINRYDKIIKLKPKKIYFNAYSENYLKIKNSKFWDNLRYNIFSKYITIYVKRQNETVISENDALVISFEQVCNKNKFVIKEYILTLKEFIEKLYQSLNEDISKITLDIDIEMSKDEFFCKKVCNYSNLFCSQARKQVTLSDSLKLIFEFEKEEIKEALKHYNSTTYDVESGTNSEVEKLQDNNNTINSVNLSNQSIISFSNMECGILNDENLVSTAFGVAINRNGCLYIFDKQRKRMVSIPKVAFTNFPIYIVPTPTLEYGDLIKLNGKYYYFLKQSDERLVVLDILTDIEDKIYAAQNILQFTVYSKIVTILDLK